MKTLALSTVGTLAVLGILFTQSTSSASVVRDVGSSEAARVYGGDAGENTNGGGGGNGLVFQKCNNYVCYSVSPCRLNSQSSEYWQGDPSTAGKQGCGWAWWGSCSNNGTVYCVQDFFTDAACTNPATPATTTAVTGNSTCN